MDLKSSLSSWYLTMPTSQASGNTTSDLSSLCARLLRLWCTTGLLPQAIAFHVLCKQIVWCYQGAPSHRSLLRWRHAVVCVYQSKQKHRAICGCHCYSALYVWMIKWYDQRKGVLKRKALFQVLSQHCNQKCIRLILGLSLSSRHRL